MLRTMKLDELTIAELREFVENAERVARKIDAGDRAPAALGYIEPGLQDERELAEAVVAEASRFLVGAI